MAKQRSTLDLTLPARLAAMRRTQWIYEALRLQILEGRLRPGARVPASRELALAYGVSRGTVVTAFEQLASEGYVRGNAGSGTFVSPVLPEHLLAARAPMRVRVGRASVRKISEYGNRVKAYAGYHIGESHAFRSNVPALDLFPLSLWGKLAARRARRDPGHLLLGCAPAGHQPLREAVADYLNASRGVKCTSEQVLMVSGVQEALDLTARILVDSGDRVCIENPGYDGAAFVFESAGARVVRLPVDDEGLRISPRQMQGARMVYVTPGHQFPLGVTMSLRRRLALLAWAHDTGAVIFEDDYDSEYRYSGHPIPALQGLDTKSSVIFAGTFGKVLFPSLRLGYIVVPVDLIDRFAAAKSLSSRHAPVLDQATLCDFMIEGHFSRHVRRMREVYAERLSTLLDAGRSRLNGLLDISQIEAGLQTTGFLRNGIDGPTASDAAAARGVQVTSLSQYSRTPLPREGLQLGFAPFSPPQICSGVRTLAAVLESLVRS